MEKSEEEFKPSYKVLETTEEERKKYQFITNEDKVQEAERLKLEGNTFFKQNNYKTALKCYHKVFFMLNGILDPDDENSKYIKKKDVPDSKTLEKSKEIKLATYLNMAQIYILNGNYEKARDSAIKSLEIKETPKGFYRRGCAYIQLNELDKAKNDLERVKEFESSMGIDKNTDLDEKFFIIKEKQKKFDNEMKNKLKKMFG